VATTLGLSYALVRECAMTVWERTYPDEEGQMVPRWKLNKTTKALKFSHKWVVGLLKRVQQSRDGGELCVCCHPGVWCVQWLAVSTLISIPVWVNFKRMFL
jgi:hypothetical protein